MTEAAPGSVRRMQLVVSDIEAALAELAERGVDVSEVRTFPWGPWRPQSPGWVAGSCCR